MQSARESCVLAVEEKVGVATPSSSPLLLKDARIRRSLHPATPGRHPEPRGRTLGAPLPRLAARQACELGTDCVAGPSSSLDAHTVRDLAWASLSTPLAGTRSLAPSVPSVCSKSLNAALCFLLLSVHVHRPLSVHARHAAFRRLPCKRCPVRFPALQPLPLRAWCPSLSALPIPPTHIHTCHAPPITPWHPYFSSSRSRL